MKNIFFILRKMLSVLVLVVILVGCTTTQYGVEISNVQNIREIYIRNSGTANWGTNLVNNIQKIDRSKFSEWVDIRVIDANGIAYSRYNLSFNDAAFGESSVSRYMGVGTHILIAGVGIGVLIPLVIFRNINNEE